MSLPLSGPSPADAPPARRARVDLVGTTLLCIALVGFVFGFSQTQGSSVSSVDVWLPIAVSVVSQGIAGAAEIGLGSSSRSSSS